MKIAAEKLRNLRTRLLEVRRTLAGFPTQYTPDMPAPAIPDPVYDNYKATLDKLNLLNNSISALEITAQNAINTINKSSQEFTEARALEEECSIHKTYGNCHDAGFCSIWVQRAGEDGGKQEHITEEQRANVIDGKGAVCIPANGFKTGRMTSDKNNRLFFWSETGLPDMRATADANNKGLLSNTMTGLVNWWKGTSVDAEEAAASLDATLSGESMLADHHKIRLLQMRLKQLEVQMRKQYESPGAQSAPDASNTPSTFQGPYPSGSSDEKKKAKQDRFEELKKQYTNYLQDYNNILSDIALDSPGDANGLASVFYDNSAGLLDDLQKGRKGGVKHSKQLRFLLECAAHNFVGGEHVQYFWYDDRQSLAAMAAKTSEMALRDTNRTGVVIAEILSGTTPGARAVSANLEMNKQTAGTNGYPARPNRIVQLKLPLGYKGDVLYMRKNYVTKTVADFANGTTLAKSDGSPLDTADRADRKTLEMLTGMPTPMKKNGSGADVYVGANEDTRPLYLIKVGTELKIDHHMARSSFPTKALGAAPSDTDLDTTNGTFHAAFAKLQQRNKSIMRTVGFDDRMIQKLQSQIMLSTLTSNRGNVQEGYGGFSDRMYDRAYGIGSTVRNNIRDATGLSYTNLKNNTLNWLSNMRKNYSPLRRMKGGEDYDVQSLSTSGSDIVSYMNSINDDTPSLMSTETKASAAAAEEIPSLMSTEMHSEEELLAPSLMSTATKASAAQELPSLMSTATKASAADQLTEVSLMSTATNPIART